MTRYKTPIPAMLAASLQGSLNALLNLDPNSVERLKRINERVLKLELQGLEIDLYFSAGNESFMVTLDHPHSDTGTDSGPPQAEATVSGTPAALFSMAADELGAGWSGPDSRVTISGDAALARDFERLFSRLDPDFEGALAGLFGDVAGHQLAQGFRQGLQAVRETPVKPEMCLEKFCVMVFAVVSPAPCWL